MTNKPPADRSGRGALSNLTAVRRLWPLIPVGAVLYTLLELGMDRVLPDSVWGGCLALWIVSLILVLLFRPALAEMSAPLDQVALLMLGVVFVVPVAINFLASAENKTELNGTSRDLPELSASQFKLLQTMWNAAANWGADRLVVTVDGRLMPAGRFNNESLDLAREVLGWEAHRNETPVPEIESLVTGMPGEYIRLVPIDGGFDVAVTLEITPEGRRYLHDVR